MTMLLSLMLAAAPAAAPQPPLPAPQPLPARAPAAAKPTREQVMAAVRSEWPHYDQGGKGRLTPLEFSTWVMKAHGGTVAPRAHAGGIAPVSAMNASATAFARADTDHDGGVTPDEMTRFLMAPATPPVRAKATAPAPARPFQAVAGN